MNQRQDLSVLLDCSLLIKEIFPVLVPVFREQVIILQIIYNKFKKYSFSFLKTKPVSIRKYATEMVFAGYLYNQVNLEKNTLRCYLIANILYEHLGWQLIKENIATMLGKNFSDIGDLLSSMKHFREALENIRQSDLIERHSSLLRETFVVIGQIEGMRGSNQLKPEEQAKYVEELLRLPLPKIKDETFDILLQSDYFIYKNDRVLYRSEKEANENTNNIINVNPSATWHNLGRIVNGFINDKAIQYKLDNKEEQLLKIYDLQWLYEKNELLCAGPRETFIDEEIILEFKVENPFKVLVFRITFYIKMKCIGFN